MRTIYKLIHGTSLSEIERGVNDYLDKLYDRYTSVEANVNMKNYNIDEIIPAGNYMDGYSVTKEKMYAEVTAIVSISTTP